MPKRIMGGVIALVASAALVFGLGSIAAATTDSSSATKPETAVSASCAQLRKRLVGAPATLRRVDANVTELRARLAEVRLPVRRTILEQRIERLEQLRSELQSKIAEARAACSTTGANTT